MVYTSLKWWLQPTSLWLKPVQTAQCDQIYCNQLQPVVTYIRKLWQLFDGVEFWTISDIHFSMCPIKKFTISSFCGPWPHDWAFWSIMVSHTTVTTTFGFSIILVEAHNLKLRKQYKWVLAQMHCRQAWAAYLIHRTFIPSPPIPFAINGGFGDFWPRGMEERNWGQDVIFFRQGLLKPTPPPSPPHAKKGNYRSICAQPGSCGLCYVCHPTLFFPLSSMSSA